MLTAVGGSHVLTSASAITQAPFRVSVLSVYPDRADPYSLLNKMPLNIDHEIEVLKKAINDYGSSNADGKKSVSYGVLFEKTVDTLEALNGTLRAAKRQKKVAFDAELLMMPRDKDVQVILLED